MTLLLDETNFGQDGHYKLSLFGFSSTKGACPPRIEIYEVSTSDTTRDGLASSDASINPGYAGENSNFDLVLYTHSLSSPKNLYVWAKDYETRWDEWAVSRLVKLAIICGSEEISTSEPVLAFALPLNSGGQLIDFSSEVAPTFLTSKS